MFSELQHCDILLFQNVNLPFMNQIKALPLMTVKKNIDLLRLKVIDLDISNPDTTSLCRCPDQRFIREFECLINIHMWFFLTWFLKQLLR